MLRSLELERCLVLQMNVESLQKCCAHEARSSASAASTAWMRKASKAERRAFRPTAPEPTSVSLGVWKRDKNGENGDLFVVEDERNFKQRRHMSLDDEQTEAEKGNLLL